MTNQFNNMITYLRTKLTTTLLIKIALILAIAFMLYAIPTAVIVSHQTTTNQEEIRRLEVTLFDPQQGALTCTVHQQNMDDNQLQKSGPCVSLPKALEILSKMIQSEQRGK